MLCAVDEPKLGLNCTKLVLGLQSLSCLSEDWSMSSRKISKGGWSWSGGVPSPITTMSGVGHELSQQLSLLVP
jgi:hypothetical protein